MILDIIMQTCVVRSRQSIALKPLIVILVITLNCHSWITGLYILFNNLKHCVVWFTGTCFIQKIYAPSSSLLQGKHLPFSPSPLRLNIFRLFVILSLPPQTKWTRIFSERSLFYF